ncbi:NTP transferase domain-containing protein [Haloferax sp. MBLA0076]|uniref:NTP transferase domain-containing protein n=1 Tax=Haloferax litoreum TaxID=2666140 RepID=A0A6A8GDC4_9EURY|nr:MULTISPECIES: sugar phosphate nucleotidyltransferase [Haloferax]KAB1192621.1 mannose-1-phosphate guanylyltransferase [Haloferax sp. CBA1148]MRX21095.1 NTP transferase domain-containing protein [Haloferax litoreum]
MDRPIVALVLAGGTGTRLFPASRSTRPKQFLSLDGDQSLLSETVARADFADHVVVSTRPAFADQITDHAPDADVVVEPAAKDTGPALVYATHRIADLYDNPVVVVLPSDHHVGEGFSESMARGARVAADTDSLVAFGVDPTRPDTGYGYIEPGTDRGDYRDLVAFHEKPDAETATTYVEDGYLWNAGMFAWTPDALFSAARASSLEPLVDALDDGDADAGFEAVEAVSIDYAVMERATDAAVVPVHFEWDDLGSWDALARILTADEDGNVALGDDPTFVDAADNVVATDGANVSLVGVSDLAVVSWDDTVLVVPKAEAQRVREVVAQLKEAGRF